MNFVDQILPRGTLRRRIVRSANQVVRGHQYRWRTDDSLSSPFFIVGSGRCGTTLLRRLLQAHPNLHIPPENWAMGTWLTHFAENRSRLSWEELCGALLNALVTRNQGWFEAVPVELFQRLNNLPDAGRTLADFIDCLYRYHASMQGVEAACWGDKTPLNVNYMPAILHLFPDARFVFLIRDPADVVYSWSKVPKYLGNIVEPAKRWKDAFDDYTFMAQKHAASILLVRYENLVRTTVHEMRVIATFLGISYEPDWIDNTSHLEQMQDVGCVPHLRASTQQVSQASIGKGRKALTDEQRRALHESIGKQAARAGYAPFFVL